MTAFGLPLYFERMVKNFSRYNKYTHGTALREITRDVVMLVDYRCPHLPAKGWRGTEELII